MLDSQLVNSRSSPAGQLNFCGPAVSRLRTAKGWSQEKLANKCQLSGWDASRDVIARIELRNRLVTDWEIIALAKALSCEPAELLT